MWDDDGAYERFMGRWSRALADAMVARLLADGARAGRWLDVGCGTGSVTAAVLQAGVEHVVAVEPSPAFAASARRRFADHPVEVHRADATTLPAAASELDAVVSGLVLNFTPDPAAALRAARSRLAPGGRALFAVWDYADERSWLARFWQAVQDVLGAPHEADERHGFGRAELSAAAAAAGWDPVVLEFDVPTPFVDRDDLWEPFLAGIGPAGAALAGLTRDQAAAVRDLLLADVLGPGGGPATLPFRALAVTATGP